MAKVAFAMTDANCDFETFMIEKILAALFPARERARKEREGLALLRAILENEMATVEMQNEARASDTPYALLTPTVPLDKVPNAGWFGGAPRLPNDAAWPELDGEPLLFVCQINLSALPRAIWSGLGPRKGSLAIFVNHTGRFAAKVLHVDGPLNKREGPPQALAPWFLGRAYAERDGRPFHLREWPITISEHVGEPPPPERKPRSRLEPDFFFPTESEFRDLSDPRSHPFNEETLDLLLESIGEDLRYTEHWIDVMLEKKRLRDADSEKLTQAKETLRQSLARFSLIKSELEPLVQNFDLPSVKSFLNELAPIPTFDVDYLRDDEEGFAVVELPARTLNQIAPANKPRCWWYPYLEGLYCHSLSAYVEDPSALPLALRERMEPFWKLDATIGRGAMGHAPEGHIYTPHGPKSTNEVLLELPSSYLIGWAWAGFYSIVLLIDRAALAHGDFSCVQVDITN